MKDETRGLKTLRRRDFLASAAAASAMFVIRPAVAQANWPEKPVNMIIMYAPGGGTDTLLRVIGNEMANAAGWTVEPINKPGAVGGIATNFVLQQPSDGYNILGAANFNRFVRVMGHTDSILWKDWSIFQAANSIAAWSVAQDSPLKTIQDLVDYDRENPGSLTISTSGTGGVWHELGMIIADAIGIKPQWVPYQGGKPATLAGLQGETQISGGGVHEHLELLRDGQLRNLFQASANDITLDTGTVLPSIANMVESLKPILPLGAEYNILIKRDTPIEIQREIKTAFEAAIASQAFKDICESQYFEIEMLAGEAADRKAARLETQTADIFNRYQDQIGAEVRTSEELGLPTPAEFEQWWPPEGYQPVEL